MIETPIDALAGLAEAGPAAALFDADGVLWHGDVSEDFTLWMLERGHFPADLWPRYELVNAADPARGCFEILGFYRGLALAEVRDHAGRFWRQAPARRWIRRTLDALRWVVNAGHTAYVVSGTPRPVLEPLCRHLPVEPHRVLGLELEADREGRATGRSTGIATVGIGKAERVKSEVAAPIILAVGNSSLDIEMLELSRGLAWAINPDPALREVAEREGWLITQERDS